jgi:hypothetical protein
MKFGRGDAVHKRFIEIFEFSVSRRNDSHTSRSDELNTFCAYFSSFFYPVSMKFGVKFGHSFYVGLCERTFTRVP